MDTFMVVVRVNNAEEFKAMGMSQDGAEAVEQAIIFTLQNVGAVFVEPEQIWRIEIDGGAGEREFEILTMEEEDGHS